MLPQYITMHRLFNYVACMNADTHSHTFLVSQTCLITMHVTKQLRILRDQRRFLKSESCQTSLASFCWRVISSVDGGYKRCGLIFCNTFTCGIFKFKLRKDNLDETTTRSMQNSLESFTQCWFSSKMGCIKWVSAGICPRARTIQRLH